jgi:hypothetical protein
MDDGRSAQIMIVLNKFDNDTANHVEIKFLVKVGDDEKKK